MEKHNFCVNLNASQDYDKDNQRKSMYESKYEI